jgi:hypothetical protein
MGGLGGGLNGGGEAEGLLDGVLLRGGNPRRAGHLVGARGWRSLTVAVAGGGCGGL